MLINDAGLGTPQSAGAAPDADALAVLDVNLAGPWRVTSAALPLEGAVPPEDVSDAARTLARAALGPQARAHACAG